MEHSFSSYVSLLWKKITQAWSLDTRSLSLFRVGLAFVILADLLLRSRYLVEHYTDSGIYPRAAFQSIGETITTFSLHGANGYVWFQVLLFILHGLFALGLFVGFRTKIMTVFLWLLTISLQNRNTLINSGADDLLRMVLFWSMFLPLDRHWSWGKEDYGVTVTRIISIGTIGYILQQCLMYWVTAYLKFGPEWYVEHSAIYQMLALETFHLPLSNILFQFPALMRVVTWGSMLIEFMAPLFLIIPLFNTWFRIIGILGIVFLHGGILTHMSVGIFPWISIVSILALLPGKFWQWIQAGNPEGKASVYFDNHCGLCGRWVQALRNFGTLSGVTFIALTDAPEKVRKLSQKHDMWVILRERKHFLGYDAFVELMKQSWLFRWYGKIGSYRCIQFLGRRLYRLIASKRKYCSLSAPKLPNKAHPWITKGGSIVALLGLYCIIVINISTISCGPHWRIFMKGWPVSGVHILQERHLRLVDYSNTGGAWMGPNMTQPGKAVSCRAVNYDTFMFPLDALLKIHSHILHWAVYLPRLDQYWWMFAPKPLDADQWLVIDGRFRSENGSVLHRDLWEDFAFHETTDGRVSFEKYTNPHDITFSDRWRKYTYNIFATKKSGLKKYFSKYWCQKYNSNGDNLSLESVVIYGVSEHIYPNYIRGITEKKILWRECCLVDGCFKVKQ